MSKRSRISDVQREILEAFYRRGMVGTGSLYKEMVEKAATDTRKFHTSLTKTQVEVRKVHTVFTTQCIYFMLWSYFLSC